jgi:peroxiredoxin
VTSSVILRWFSPNTLAWVIVLAGLRDAAAQHIIGSLPVGAAGDGYVHLLVSRGSRVRALDSVPIGPDGRFRFTPRDFAQGFYHLAINDTDRVDIILGTSEPSVTLDFSGIPLQENIAVHRSEENKRLWDHKRVSRQVHAILSDVVAQKHGLSGEPASRLEALDSMANRALALKRAFLDGVVTGYPESYFAKVINADRSLESAVDRGPHAVLEAFDLSDASLMRSSLYDKAVMTYLRNLRPVNEEQFIGATDTLLERAGRDPECRAYMVDYLLELFSTYGPETALRHLIDRELMSPNSLGSMDPKLRSIVEEVRRVRVGAQAPDVMLPDTVAPVPLRSIVERNRYTVLFFYSSDCEHCHAEMPALKEVYATFKPLRTEVIGVALDADSSEFERTVVRNGLPWRCFSEFNGWGSTIAKAYRVKATPWFYVLDQRMLIADIPVDAVALHNWLQEHAR